MKRNDLIALVRRLIADEQAAGFTAGGSLEQPEGTQELLNYLDRAVVAYSMKKIEERDVRFLRGFVPVNGGRLPDDFIIFAGAVPISTTGGIVSFYGPPLALPVRYFARLPYASAFGEGEEVPYRHDDMMAVAALAAVYALNKQEYNVSQDLALLGMGPAGGGAPVAVSGEQGAERGAS